MKTINKIQVYEIDDKETGVKAVDPLIIESHWNRSNFVVLKYGDINITVSGDDLLKSIKNSQNVR